MAARKKSEESEPAQAAENITSLGALQEEERLSTIKHKRDLPGEDEKKAIERLLKLSEEKNAEGKAIAERFTVINEASILSSGKTIRAGKVLHGIIFDYGKKFYHEPETGKIFY